MPTRLNKDGTIMNVPSRFIVFVATTVCLFSQLSAAVDSPTASTPEQA
jgi:hypothetical protein